MNMENTRIDILFRDADENDRSQIRAFIELVDSEFYPPLSRRPGGIEGRIENSLAKPEANFLLAEGISYSGSSLESSSASSPASNLRPFSGLNSESWEGQIPQPDRPSGPDTITCSALPAGLISYEKQWEGENNAYISFIAVNPGFRNMGIASKLISRLEARMSFEGMEKLYVCTWSTNHSALALYGKKGFSTSRVIKDDRGPFVDTVYMVKSLN